MKKIFVSLLAVVLLCAFCVGVGAEMQEEIEAEGRAMLVQAMEDLRGKYYANTSFPSGSKAYRGLIVNHLPYQVYFIAHLDGEYALMKNWTFQSPQMSKDLILRNEILRVFPATNEYQKLLRSPMQEYLALLEPKTVASAVRVTLDSYGRYEVVFDGVLYRFSGTGKLLGVERGDVKMNVSFNNTDVDPLVFSTEGMRQISFVKAWVYDATWLTLLFILFIPILLPIRLFFT